MKKNVSPQRKVVVNLFTGKLKQVKAKRRDAESISIESLHDSFRDLSDDKSNISIN
jgi:hypothetical protein